LTSTRPCQAVGLSRNVEASRASEILNSYRIVEQSLGYILRVYTVLQHAIGASDRDDRQAVEAILVANYSL
jgi:hypothetical protein